MAEVAPSRCTPRRRAMAKEQVGEGTQASQRVLIGHPGTMTTNEGTKQWHLRF